MKILTAILVVILGVTQYTLWFSKNGVKQYIALKHQISLQQQTNMTFSLRNEHLVEEISRLKHNDESIESHAREDLGMIKPNESFYQIIPKPNQSTHL